MDTACHVLVNNLCTRELNNHAKYANLTDCYRLAVFPSQKHGSSYNFSINSDPLTSGDCRFMNGSGRGVTGLVSFPGSGNTWVRELLQTVTGICTGTVFSDHSEPIKIRIIIISGGSRIIDMGVLDNLIRAYSASSYSPRTAQDFLGPCPLYWTRPCNNLTTWVDLELASYCYIFLAS